MTDTEIDVAASLRRESSFAHTTESLGRLLDKAAAVIESVCSERDAARRDATGWKKLFETEKDSSTFLDEENVKLTSRAEAAEAHAAQAEKERDNARWAKNQWREWAESAKANNDIIAAAARNACEAMDEKGRFQNLRSNLGVARDWLRAKSMDDTADQILVALEFMDRVRAARAGLATTIGEERHG